MKKSLSVLLSLSLFGSMAILPAAAVGLDQFKPTLTYTQNQFQDVTPNDWFAPPVAYAYALNLMKGTSSDTFSPMGQVDLASAITLAARLHLIYHEGDPAIFDQKQGEHWYDTYVDYAIMQDIASPKETRSYTDPISRAELAGLLACTFPPEAFAPLNQLSDGTIPDVSTKQEISAIYTLYRAGVLTGVDSAGNFAPDRLITRAELCAIIARTVDPTQRQSSQAPTQNDDETTAKPPDSASVESKIPPAERPTPPPKETDSGPIRTPADPAKAAQAILALVNEARDENDLAPLELDATITQAANVRAEEIMRSYSHDRPDGSSCFTILEENNVSFQAAGENIAYGQATAEAVMEAWMNSAGHKANILNEDFSRLGVGLFEKDGTLYWVQLFCG